MKRVGILALQGGFSAHQRRLRELHVPAIEIRKASELSGIDGLVFPGGESGVMLRLLELDLKNQLMRSITAGLPVLSTCAGTILLAKNVSAPIQESFGLIDIDVERNAYGRQLDSFTDSALSWTPNGQEALRQMGIPSERIIEPLEGVYIRAPKITRCGPNVVSLIEEKGDPIFVKENNVLAATFHPELSNNSLIHEIFLKHVSG